MTARAQAARLRDSYDLIVVGGGIHGAALAWEATSRGLATILLERDDFGAATSANSLKIIHGGLRYIQRADLGRVLESSAERDALRRIAPHLVQPLACLMPTRRTPFRSRTALRAAFAAYDLLGHIARRDATPRSHLLSRAQCRMQLPWLSDRRATGAAVWYDAQVYSPERLVLAFVRSAMRGGADALNYTEVDGAILDHGRIAGVTVTDRLRGERRTIRGRFVVNAAGPFLGRVHAAFGAPALASSWVKAVNLVYPLALAEYAVGLDTPVVRGASRLLFAAPWRGHTIVGTWYFSADGARADAGLSEAELAECRSDVARTFTHPALATLAPTLFHVGYLPARPGATDPYAALVERHRIIDHAAHGGPAGLISVLGTKYTTARAVAVATVDRVMRALGRPAGPSCTHRLALDGGALDDFDAFLDTQLRTLAGRVPAAVVAELVRHYGSNIERVLDYTRADPALLEAIPGAGAIRAEIPHAIEHEQALTLCDVLARRTGIGTAGPPADATLEYCAAAMARHLGWDDATRRANVDQARRHFQRLSRPTPA